MDRSDYPLLRNDIPPSDRGDLVVIQNTTGADIDAGGILGISGIVNTAAVNLKLFKRVLVFTGVSPNSATHSGRFVVLQRRIRKTKFGPAYIRGVCPAQVNIANIADGFADVTTSDTAKLASGSSGSAQLLYPAGATGTQWMWVAMGSGC